VGRTFGPKCFSGSKQRSGTRNDCIDVDTYDRLTWYISTITRAQALMIPLGIEHRACSTCMATLRLTQTRRWPLWPRHAERRACKLTSLIMTMQVVNIDRTVGRGGAFRRLRIRCFVDRSSMYCIRLVVQPLQYMHNPLSNHPMLPARLQVLAFIRQIK